jgi:hypothetical protein
MQVELLYVKDCPNWQSADRRLRELATSLGFAVRRRVVASPEEAEACGMRGSPTILVDGVDPFARGDEPPPLSCRLYQTPEGPAGVPTVEQLRSALVVRP